MSEFMTLIEDKVSNIDSSLMQGASTKEIEENQVNTFDKSIEELYKFENNEVLSGDDIFKFTKFYTAEDGLPKSDNDVKYSQNLEQLIQESVSKSTARLLTKNTLKYLDKDLMVSSGEGASRQFTVRSAKQRENCKKTSRKEEGYNLPLSKNGNKGLHESNRSIYIDPKISSFRLHKVTYEMYKLFENIKSFESSCRTENKSIRMPNVGLDGHNVAPSGKLEESLRKLSIVSSNFGEMETNNALFESKLKPKPFPSLSTLYPEDSNTLTYSSSNRFGNAASNFTVHSDLLDSDLFKSPNFKSQIEHGFIENPAGLTAMNSDSSVPAPLTTYTSTDFKTNDFSKPEFPSTSFTQPSYKIDELCQASYPSNEFTQSDFSNVNYNHDNYGADGHKVFSFPAEDKEFSYPQDNDASNFSLKYESSAHEHDFKSDAYSDDFQRDHHKVYSYPVDDKKFDYPSDDEANVFETSNYPAANYETTDYLAENPGNLSSYKIDLDFKENVSMEPFASAVSLQGDEGEAGAVKYSCFSSGGGSYKAPEGGNKSGNNEQSCGNNEKNSNAPNGSKQPNRQSFNSTYVTKVYAPMDRLHLMPKKRAVVVGCNYLGNPNAQLRGSCNDAFAFAHVLVTKFNFDPRDVILLLDSRPSPAYTRYLSQFSQNNPFQPTQDRGKFSLDLSRVKSNVIERTVYPGKRTSMFGRHLIERDLKHLSLSENLYVDSAVIPAPNEMQPTRANVFRSLKWLNFISSPNDFAVFYFSGQSVQVDDLSGYEGDGFDEALVPSDYERNGLVTCNDLKCLFQSIGATCRLNVFLDTCNLQTVVGGSSRAGPVKGSKMKGIWPFSEPTGKLNSFKCGDWVDKDQKMINQMTRVKFLPTLQVDSLSSLSDVQLSLDAAHGVVNYFVLSSSNLNAVSLECLFKPLNLGQVCKDNDKSSLVNNLSFKLNGSKSEGPSMVKEDEVIVHGAFTYTLLLTLLYDKSMRRGGLGVDEVVEGVNKKLTQLKRIRLPKLNQQCEALFYHSSKLPKNAFLFPPNFSKYQKPKHTDSAYGFYLPEDAWMFMVEQGRERAREHQQKFERMKTDLITLTNLNDKLFSQNQSVVKLTKLRGEDNTPHQTYRTNNATGRGSHLTHQSVLSPNNTARNPQFAQSKHLPNMVEVAAKRAMSANLRAFGTGRSLTNSVTGRVFTRTSSVPGKVTSRSKTATVNNMRSTTSGTTHRNYGPKGGKFQDVVQSHNWYGGCTVSVPFNTMPAPSEPNYYSQPTWYTNVPDGFNFNNNLSYSNDFSGFDPFNNKAANYDKIYYGKHETMPIYEPITATMLQNLPTRKLFNFVQ